MTRKEIESLNILYDDERPAYTAVFEHDGQYYYTDLGIAYDLGEKVTTKAIYEKYAGNHELALLCGTPVIVIFKSDSKGNVSLEPDGIPSEEDQVYRKPCKSFSEATVILHILNFIEYGKAIEY